METSPIFAIYVNVSDMSSQQANETMARIRTVIQTGMPKYTSFVLPCSTGDTRIECIWPKFLVVEKADVQQFLDQQEHIKNTMGMTLLKQGTSDLPL
jgi:hypothetical protein